MLDYDTTGACVLVLTLATIFVIIPLTLRAQRTEKGVGIWLLSGLTGLLLGVGLAVAAVQLLGYNLARKPAILSAELYVDEEPGDNTTDDATDNATDDATDDGAEHAAEASATEPPAAADGGVTE